MTRKKERKAFRVNAEFDACEAVGVLLGFIGEDIGREGLAETPSRVVKSYKELFAGYKVNVAKLFKTFDGEGCSEMVIVRDIEFYSTCEHHMQPFFGRAHIGYIPDGRVLGVSKLARILDAYARRLQIQERIGQQVVDALMTYLQPLGAGCVIEAKHFCMVCRGVQKQNSVMVTSKVAGTFLQPEVRAEFLNLIKD